jgi:hypothetical protein
LQPKAAPSTVPMITAIARDLGMSGTRLELRAEN